LCAFFVIANLSALQAQHWIYAMAKHKNSRLYVAYDGKKNFTHEHMKGAYYENKKADLHFIVRRFGFWFVRLCFGAGA
jgi:hypothetical protein